jgi:hypothetical protein
MKGVVDVKPVAGVGPGVGGGRALGFTAPPSPNPTRRGVSFQFAMREPGRARAEVFDTRGGLVAVVLDRDLDAGSHAASWNGRNLAGALVGPGTYYLRLGLPGLVDTRPFVVTR